MVSNMNVFKEYHPLVIAVYALFVTVLLVICNHPLGVIINFGFSFAYMYAVNKAKPLLALTVILILAIEYPLNNHQGITILSYLPDGNPVTVESVVYGLVRAIWISTAVCWFLFFSSIMTTDKLMCIFGKLYPSFSMFLSMTSRFVPVFITQTKNVIRARRGMGQDICKGNIFTRFKIMLSVFSVMTSWSIENSINISDSMKSRGYGTGHRTAFSPYKFHTRDIYLLTAIIILGMYNIVFFYTGSIGCSYFPSICFNDANVWFFTGYFALCMLPLVVEFFATRKIIVV